MALSTVVLGYESVVRINGQPFGVKGGTMDLESEENECGDSETGVFKQQKPGRKGATVSLDFYEKHGLNNHAAPLLIGEDSEISLWVYVKGLGDNPYKFTSFVLSKYNDKLSIDGKVEGSLSGKSNGQYLRPGD